MDTDIIDVENAKNICKQLLREKELSYESLDITAYTPEKLEYWEQNKQFLKVDTVSFFLSVGRLFNLASYYRHFPFYRTFGVSEFTGLYSYTMEQNAGKQSGRKSLYLFLSTGLHYCPFWSSILFKMENSV